MSGTGPRERGVGRRRSGAAGRLAWSICGLTVVLILCAVALAALNRSDVPRSGYFPSGPDGERDGRRPGRFPPSREPRRLVLPRQCRVYLPRGGCVRVRQLRVARGPGDGLADGLGVVAGGNPPPGLPATLLSRRETGL